MKFWLIKILIVLKSNKVCINTDSVVLCYVLRLSVKVKRVNLGLG